MIKKRITLLTLVISISSIITTGCWNYREVDKLAIVAGVAVDKGKDGNYEITAEIVNTTGGRETKTTSRTVSIEGKTMFDAVRNFISLSGKKLYWSHTKVLILSKEIASEGINKVIDWYNRDSETRENVRILVSKGTTAKEILQNKGNSEDIQSFIFEDILKNQVNLNKSPITNILEFNIQSQGKGISAIVPTVNLKKSNGKIMPQIIGTAILKKDRLVDFLNSEETKDLMFIRNEIKGGMIIEVVDGDRLTSVSLEVFKNKTKVSPFVEGKDIEINLNVDTTVAIDEIDGIQNFLDEEGTKKLEESAENTLKKRIELLIKKAQSEYDTDIFGFGSRLWEEEPEVWKSVSDNWEEVFKSLKVNVKTSVHIKNSGILSKSLEEGE